MLGFFLGLVSILSAYYFIKRYKVSYKKSLSYKPIAKKSKYHSTWERHKAQDCIYMECWYCRDEAN